MRRVEDVRPPVSFADLQRVPDDGKHYELYDGELRVVPAPFPIHQRVVARLLDVFLDFSKRAGGEVFTAPFDIVLSDFNVIEPDLIYFGPESVTRIKPREYVRFTPELAVEVLSPSTARIDRGPKRELVARYGLPEYWVVDPDAHSLEVSTLVGTRYREPRILHSGRYESITRPGLAIDVQQLFIGIE